MKILYSLPHPSHRLDTEGAGHTVRANALIAALRDLGAEVIIDQAAQEGSQAAAKTYRDVVKNMLPRPLAMRLRDRARVAFSHRYGERLTAAVREHQPDVILQTHIAFSVAGAVASEATGVPLVMDDVAPSWEEAQQYGVGSAALAKSTHERITGQASLCVAVSGAMRRFLVEDGIPDEKLIAIPNGITGDTFHPGVDGSAVRAKYGFTDDTPVIVFVGSFQPYHRAPWLLEVFSHLVSQTDVPVKLLMVGDGRERSLAESSAELYSLEDKVVFTGRVPYEAVPAYTAAGDIAVMPATNTYGNPMKVYEYMALGKAVVAPDQETITEIATHEQDILTFPPEDKDALAATLKRLLDDPALRARLGQNAARAIAEDHTWTKRGAVLLTEIERVLP